VDNNNQIKIKLLDDLIQEIMSLPDGDADDAAPGVGGDKPAVAELEISGDLPLDKDKKV
jgi:hypothetical protein